MKRVKRRACVTKTDQQNHHLVSIPQAYKTKTTVWQISVIEKFQKDEAGEVDASGWMTMQGASDVAHPLSQQWVHRQ